MKIHKIHKITQNQDSPYSTWFGEEMIRITNNYSTPLPYNQEQLETIWKWVNTTNPDVSNLSLLSAYKPADIWENLNNYATHDIIYKFKDGWDVVKLSYKDIESENELMKEQENKEISKEIGGEFYFYKGESPLGLLDESPYSRDQSIGTEYISNNQEQMESNRYVIYSIRDENNIPHATIETIKDGNDIDILQIFGREIKKVKDKGGWTSYYHPEEDKVKEFISHLKNEGYNIKPLDSADDVAIRDLDDPNVLTNEYDIPLSFSKIGGTKEHYYDNLIDAYQAGVSGSYWYKNTSFKIIDTLIQLAENSNELPELAKAVEGFSIQKTNKEGKGYTQFLGLDEWANDGWFDNELYIEFENPRPDDEDYPNEEDFTTYADTPEGQEEFEGMPEIKPKFDEEAYNKAIKEWEEKELAYEKELTEHQKYYEPFEFRNYVWKELNEALKRNKEENKELNNKEEKAANVNMKTKIHKTSQNVKEEDVPDGNTLSIYVESLKMNLKNNPNLNKELAILIKKLPSPRQIKLNFSFEECKILFQTVGYLWKKITGKDIIEEKKISKAPETLFGNYWMFNNGILLHGVNSYGIIKRNTSLICSLLDINNMVLQDYLSNNPNKVIDFIIRNGGVRLFINKSRHLYSQMNQDTYAKWGRAKIKKYDFKKKIVRIVDPNVEYKGWKSGIGIKL